jgi:hypothetical protein
VIGRSAALAALPERAAVQQVQMFLYQLFAESN